MKDISSGGLKNDASDGFMSCPASFYSALGLKSQTLKDFQ